MDFDLSKENIQPLRGGRNVSQLEVALHAQSDAEYLKELLQQRSAFEEAIRTYAGDDPLDNWYNFISWVEQSYPKHGHEGNLTSLLEDCLSKFQDDERYYHDRRLCKLWIKYIDSQQNPIELFQLLHSRGICASCADLYLAWAYYHEVAGDFKKADSVFQLGLRLLAQPYEELAVAHQNMIMAAGRQAIQGVDENRLIEQRQALTSLKSYKHKKKNVVGSLRTGAQIRSILPGIFPSASNGEKPNVPVKIFEEKGAEASCISTSSLSVLDIIRKQEDYRKENILKPGPWSLLKLRAQPAAPSRTPSFTVHEDEQEQLPQFQGHIKLPPGFCGHSEDDFSDWIVPRMYPEPEDHTKIPMYPKHLVYTLDGEYSPEEINARNWFARKQAERDISERNMTSMQETMMMSCQNIEFEQKVVHSSLVSNKNSQNEATSDASKSIFNAASDVDTPSNSQTDKRVLSQPLLRVSQKSSIPHSKEISDHSQTDVNQNKSIISKANEVNSNVSKLLTTSVVANDNSTVFLNALWSENVSVVEPVCLPKCPIPKFVPYEDTQDTISDDKQAQTKLFDKPLSSNEDELMDEACVVINKDLVASALKSNFSIFEDNAENADPQMSARQPTVIKTPFTSFTKPRPTPFPRKSVPLGERMDENVFVQPAIPELKETGKMQVDEETDAFNESVSTQVFNSDIARSSTPNCNKKAPLQAPQEICKVTQMQLFEDNRSAGLDFRKSERFTFHDDKLSVILETTKEYQSSSSSSSGANTFKSTFHNRESMAVIREMSCSNAESDWDHKNAN